MANQDVLEGFNAKNAAVGKTGAVRIAPVGQTVPDEIGPYDKDVYRNVGYIGPDGIELSFDEDSTEFIPWQEANPIRKDMTKSVKSIQFTLWEVTKENLALFLGVPESEIKTNANGGFYFDEAGLPEFAHHQLSLDMIDGTRKVRLVGYDTQVSARGSITMTGEEIFSLQITISFFPGSADDYPEAGGNTSRWIFEGFDDGAATAALKVLTSSLPKATKESAYSQSLSASGGTSPYTWSLEAGSLPDGLSIGDGKITGTPTASGSKQFTVKVVDSDGKSATKKLTLEVS